MTVYVCPCGYKYNQEEQEKNNNVPFSKLPDDWTCPWCGLPKDEFTEE